LSHRSPAELCKIVDEGWFRLVRHQVIDVLVSRRHRVIQQQQLHANKQRMIDDNVDTVHAGETLESAAISVVVDVSAFLSS
jgi:hypothetical protein